MPPPVCVLHRQLSRQRKAKYDEQIELHFSPASTLALQVGPAQMPPPRAHTPRAHLSVQDQRAPSFRTILLSLYVEQAPTSPSPR